MKYYKMFFIFENQFNNIKVSKLLEILLNKNKKREKK